MKCEICGKELSEEEVVDFEVLGEADMFCGECAKMLRECVIFKKK